MAASPSEPGPEVGLVWAQARGGVIGAGGTLPWDLPEDLAHFAATTRGRPVVMGRRTWDSLPARARPLPGRPNVVLSRDPGLAVPGAHLAADLDAALGAALALGGPGRCWVVGGQSVYRAAVPRADLAVVTEVDLDVAGDTWAPDLDAAWVGDDPPWRTSRTGTAFRVRTWHRVAAAARTEHRVVASARAEHRVAAAARTEHRAAPGPGR